MSTAATSRNAGGRVNLESLQVGRAFAAQYVVLCHAPLLMSEHLGVQMWNPILAAGHSGVEFFFVLSGFIMFVVHGRDIGQPERARRFMSKRIIRIYPLFWVLFSIFLLGQIITGRIDPHLDGPMAYLRAYTLAPFATDPPMRVAWTLSHELLFYLLLSVCILAGGIGIALMGAWWLACLAALAYASIDQMSVAFPQSFLLSPYNLLFLLGIAATFIHTTISTSQAAILLITGLAGFMLTIAHDATLPEKTLRPIYYGLASAAIVAGLAGLERRTGIGFPRWLVFLGDASYSTYLAHSIAMIACAMILTAGHLQLGAVATVSLLIVAGTVGGMITHLLIERPLLRFIHHKRQQPPPLTTNDATVIVSPSASQPEDRI
ncbi:acyltransferase [Paracoccus sp. Z330]|uniref:Acyltransferase n=1 Tax=Paracoccus onchidii TaxID=3017813 RepID=A0ABT4ZEW1_9RHOB|nr:acyltransferase [Paracoccus onchidii]MDB6177894.1 acyltransferase [Paracoccus onchidii]